MRGEEADRVVAPVVGEAAGRRGTPRARSVARAAARPRSRRGRRGERSPLRDPARRRFRAVRRDGGMISREALDVELVDDRVGVARRSMPGCRSMRTPDRPRCCAARGRPSRDRSADPHRRRRSRTPRGRSGRRRWSPGRTDRGGAWLDCSATPCDGVVRTGDAIAVGLAGADTLDEAVPDTGVVVGQLNAGFDAVVVEQAQVDAVCHVRRHGEVRPLSNAVAPSGYRVPGRERGATIVVEVTMDPRRA